MRRVSVVIAGLALLAGAGVACARDRAATAYATEALPPAGARLVAATTGVLVLTTFDAGAWLWNSATRQVVRRFDSDARIELLPSDHLRQLLPVAVLRDQLAGKSRRIVMALSGDEVATVAATDNVLMVARTPRGWMAVTLDVKVEAETADAGTSPRQLVLRLQGQAEPLKIISLPPDPPKTRSPAIAISADGRLFGVAWKNAVRVVDLTTGAERVFSGDVATKAAVTALAFTSDDQRIILMTETGPMLIVEVATLKVIGTLVAPDIGRRFEIVSHAKGQVLAIEGRRQRAFVDTATGKHVLAQRMSSGSGYLIRWIGKDLLLRGARGRRAPTTQYGVYRREKGEFKMLYRHERAKMNLGTLAASPNGACLFLASPDGAEFNDLLTDKPITAVDGLVAPLDQAVFSADGRRIVAVDETGKFVTIEAPRVCQGAARA